METKNHFYPLNANIRIHYPLGYSWLIFHSKGKSISKSQFHSSIDFTSLRTIDPEELFTFINTFEKHIVHIDLFDLNESFKFTSTNIEATLFGNNIELKFTHLHSNSSSYQDLYESVKKNWKEKFTTPAPDRNPLVIKDNTTSP